MLYEILKTSKLGASFAPDMYTALWAQKLARDGEVKTLSGAPPLSFKANGQPLLDYLISGNTVQSGTPTPDNPVMPQGTGERTGNLVNVASSNCIVYSNYNQFTIDNSSVDITGNALFGFIVKCDSDTIYSVSCIRTGYNIDMRIREYSNLPSDWSTDFITQSVNQSASAGSSATFTTTATTTHLLVCFYGSNTSHISNIMLNSGSTALPYEPYGYKIPFLNNSQTTNVYLGEVQSTRNIKKLVFDGTEDWMMNADGWFYLASVSDDYLRSEGNITSLCSHYPTYKQSSAIAQLPDDYTGFSWGSAQRLYLKDTSHRNDLSSFKQWVAAQYAAGTPVTVWYVLATEETGIVNEPLMKIGDYADTVSMEQAGVEIPTARGTNTLDALTNVKPSEIYIKYKS